MRCSASSVVLCLSLAITLPVTALLSEFVNAAEQSKLLCSGKARNTARVYRKNGLLMVRIFDRTRKVILFNGLANSVNHSNAITYSNKGGKLNIRVTSNPKQSGLCSIQVGKALEEGTLAEFELGGQSN